MLGLRKLIDAIRPPDTPDPEEVRREREEVSAAVDERMGELLGEGRRSLREQQALREELAAIRGSLPKTWEADMFPGRPSRRRERPA